MKSRDRTAKEVVANIATAGALVVCVMLASSAIAAADPPAPGVPADPTVPAPPAATGMIPPLSTLTQPLAQSGATPETMTGGLPDRPFAGGPDNEYVLAQNPVPEAPGEAPGGTPPNLTAFNNAYLLPQNLVPAAPGEGQLYDVAPGKEAAAITPLDLLRRVHHMHVDGYLKGGLLGQKPPEEFGEPVPPPADPVLPVPASPVQ